MRSKKWRTAVDRVGPVIVIALAILLGLCVAFSIVSTITLSRISDRLDNIEPSADLEGRVSDIEAKIILIETRMPRLPGSKINSKITDQ